MPSGWHLQGKHQLRLHQQMAISQTCSRPKQLQASRHLSKNLHSRPIGCQKAIISDNLAHSHFAYSPAKSIYYHLYVSKAFRQCIGSTKMLHWLEFGSVLWQASVAPPVVQPKMMANPPPPPRLMAPTGIVARGPPNASLAGPPPVGKASSVVQGAAPVASSQQHLLWYLLWYKGQHLWHLQWCKQEHLWHLQWCKQQHLWRLLWCKGQRLWQLQ